MLKKVKQMKFLLMSWQRLLKDAKRILARKQLEATPPASFDKLAKTFFFNKYGSFDESC